MLRISTHLPHSSSNIIRIRLGIFSLYYSQETNGLTITLPVLFPVIPKFFHQHPPEPPSHCFHLPNTAPQACERTYMRQFMPCEKQYGTFRLLHRTLTNAMICLPHTRRQLWPITAIPESSYIHDKHHTIFPKLTRDCLFQQIAIEFLRAFLI